MSMVNCPVCGSSFEVRNLAFGIYCSRLCRAKAELLDNPERQEETDDTQQAIEGSYDE